MIEIIKQGDPKKTDYFLTFECRTCGCVWKADYDDYRTEHTDGWYYICVSSCPDCQVEACIIKDICD